MKKAPDVTLEHVIEYGDSARPARKGYIFMDSPGNDLESIAGQVAMGSNMSKSFKEREVVRFFLSAAHHPRSFKLSLRRATAR